MSIPTSIQRAALYLFTSLLVTVGSLTGQTQFRIPLFVNDNTVKRDTLTFGIHPQASYCIDGVVLRFGNCDSVVEAEQPPKPPTGVFDVRFVDSRTGAGACLGVGVAENIQGFTGSADVDTFQLSFQPGAGGYPFTFRWPAGISQFADSMRIRDLLGLPPQFGGVSVDMFSVDSVRVTNNLITGLYIFVYHPKAPTYPVVPTPSTPANNAVDVDTSTTLVWTASASASEYVLQVSESSTFNTFVLRDTLTATSRAVSLAPNKTYYWRVSANHPFLTGCFSAASQFMTITTCPDAATLVSPAQGATNVALSPTLSWNAVPNATSYRVEISRVANFATIEFVDSNVVGTSRAVGPFPNCVTRYWRVLSQGASGSCNYSVVRNFTTVLAAPGVPAPLSPADNALGQPTTLTLSWSVSDSCSKTYRLEVSEDSMFTGPLVFDNLTTTFRSVGPLAELTKHYWRVRAKNQGTDTSVYSVVRTFTTLLNPPAAPTLTAPANGDTTVPQSPVLTWLSGTHVDSFQVQVATDAGFTAIIEDATTTDTTYQTSPLANCKTFWWRVRGLNVSGTGSFSSRSFRVTRALSSAPTLLVPAYGTIDVDEVTDLIWQAEACAFQYRVELAKDSIFTVIVTDQIVASTSLTVGPLDGNTDHFWRVRGVNNLGQGTPSAPFRFRTTALTTPPKPVLLSPVNGAQSLPLPVTVCWDSAARATSYRLQLSLDSIFSVLTFDDTSGAFNRCRQFDFLLNSTTYYWRVNATNAAGTSAFSNTSRFSTLSPPVAPTLISPANNAEDVTAAPVFVWSVPQNAVSYRLQVARDTGFTSIFSDDSNLVNTSWQTGPFQSHTRYYWRVRAKNSVGSGPWSPAFTFRTTYIGVANWLMPLAVRETGQARDTIYLGLHPDATCRIEAWLGEYELPPPPFPGTFDARFISTGNPDCGIGEGLRVNLLPFNTYTQVDTYRVRFQPGTGTYPITFSWDNIFIGSVCDSMLMIDEFGGNNVYSRMDLTNSASVTNTSISSVLLVRYGAFPLINDVRPPAPKTPSGYMLAQNYPNPFNPTTRITFSTDHSARITVTVFDVLGREVALLADDDYFQGVYTVTWNAANPYGSRMPSGVYYVRMTATSASAGSDRGVSFVETRKMLLLK